MLVKFFLDHGLVRRVRFDNVQIKYLGIIAAILHRTSYNSHPHSNENQFASKIVCG